MGYQFKCRNCHQFLFLERVSDENTAYECHHCQASNWIDSSFHGLEVMSRDKFDRQGHTFKQVDSTDLKDKNNKYPALKTISGFYNFIAILSVIVAVIGLIYGATLFDSSYTETQGIIMVISSIIYGLIAYLLSKAVAEGILLFIDIANDLNDLKTNLLKDD